MPERFDYVGLRREEVMAIPRRLQGFARWVVKTWMRWQLWVYKKTNGKCLNTLPGGYEICIVSVTGRKTGKKRDIGLVHLPRGDNKYLVASLGGMEQHPLWYYNVKANPVVSIRVKYITRQYRARELDSDEKREVWPHLVSIYPDFDQYQARTDRDIPVFICEPCELTGEKS